jgi:hypothetical protein
MVAEGYLRPIDGSRSVGLGEKADRLTYGYQGLSVFRENLEFTVSEGPRSIGSIAARRIRDGERFILAGRPWSVVGVDETRKHLSVQPAGDAEAGEWHGNGGPPVDDRVVARGREILVGGLEPLGRMGPGTEDALVLARQRAAQFVMGENSWYPTMRRRHNGNREWWATTGGVWTPWRGTRGVESALAALTAAHAMEHGEAPVPFSDILAPWQVRFECDRPVAQALCERAMEMSPTQIASHLHDGSIVGVKFSENLPRSVLEHRWLTDDYDHEVSQELLAHLHEALTREPLGREQQAHLAHNLQQMEEAELAVPGAAADVGQPEDVVAAMVLAAPRADRGAIDAPHPEGP